jgi:L-2-hydroxyglutarate oxidase LhgO
MTGTGPASVGVIGAGIVGLAVARQMSLQYPGIDVAVFEKEDRVAAHQSGHNSGVVHAGVYYRPGSLKARLCLRGASLLREYCAERDIRYRELGKLIVASDSSELAGLSAIEDRARRNGVPGISRITQDDIAGLEPSVTGVAALHSPHTAVVDYVGVCEAIAGDVRRAGGRIFLSSPVTALAERGSCVEVRVADSVHQFDQVIVCGGLQSDRLARAAGQLDDLRIIPFRGEYYALRAEAGSRIHGLVYPVPDPRYPFLGVHFTPDVADKVHVGPNAVLALALEGYRFTDISLRDVRELARWPGTWRLAGRHWRHGVRELTASISKRAYLSQARRYVPGLRMADLVAAGAGVRAQAVDRGGNLVDDFALQHAGRILLVRNAPSPAATSSLAIAEHIVAAAGGRLGDAPGR